MSKKFSRNVLFSSLMAFCSGVSINAMQINKGVDNNNLEVSKSNSEGQNKGFGPGTLAVSNVVSFVIGGGMGYLGSRKISAPIVEENIKLRSENEELKQKGTPISKEDYDKKRDEIKKLKADIEQANNEIKDLKNEIAKLKDQLKTFTDVWGDSSDDDKMKKMKALHDWRYGDKKDKSYDSWLKTVKEKVKAHCVFEETKKRPEYSDMISRLLDGDNSNEVTNWISNVLAVEATKIKLNAYAYYNRAMLEINAHLGDLRRSLSNT